MENRLELGTLPIPRNGSSHRFFGSEFISSKPSIRWTHRFVNRIRLINSLSLTCSVSISVSVCFRE